MNSLFSQKNGFSIPELIIVIVVIGILSSIAIVSYGNSQKRAQDAAVTADLEQMADQFEIFRTRSATDVYPASQADLESLDINITKSAYLTSVAVNVYACVAADLKSLPLYRKANQVTF